MAGQHLGFCSRGGKIAVFKYQGGQALHAIQYNIYSKISRGGGANAPPPHNETLCGETSSRCGKLFSEQGLGNFSAAQGGTLRSLGT